MVLYVDFEEALAAIFGANPALPTPTLRHDAAIDELRRTWPRRGSKTQLE